MFTKRYRNIGIEDTMDGKEQIERETIKNLLKLTVMNNSSFDPAQKQQICIRIDNAAEQASWIVDMLQMCGYIS